MDLLMYVSGRGGRSASAVAIAQHLDALLAPLGGRCEVIDVLAHPDAAETDRIVATPTLVRRHPAPTLRIVGEITDVPMLYTLLGFEFAEETASS